MPSDMMNSQAKPLKLLLHRSEAQKFITGQIEKGNALREQKIRSATGLERAREQKLEWTQATTVLLSKIFESDSVIEEYNAWKGKILPEFADLDPPLDGTHAAVIGNGNVALDASGLPAGVTAR